MFGNLRGPGGRFTLLMSGLALLLLAAVLLPAAAMARLAVVPAALALTGAACVVVWWRRRKAEQYDLKRLFDDPPAVPGEAPYEDTVAVDEDAAPYCGWCDEAYAPGVRRCVRCGRDL
jgi:hypothetical protein